MLISRTSPSKPGSVLYRFRKLNLDCPPAATAIVGEVTSERATLDASDKKTSLGAVSGNMVEVVAKVPRPDCVVVQPAGRAGATTLSKFSLKELANLPVTNV